LNDQDVSSTEKRAETLLARIICIGTQHVTDSFSRRETDEKLLLALGRSVAREVCFGGESISQKRLLVLNEAERKMMIVYSL